MQLHAYFSTLQIYKYYSDILYTIDYIGRLTFNDVGLYFTLLMLTSCRSDIDFWCCNVMFKIQVRFYRSRIGIVKSVTSNQHYAVV